LSDEKLCPVHHSFIVMSGRLACCCGFGGCSRDDQQKTTAGGPDINPEETF
jgi:hypothetical protein